MGGFESSAPSVWAEITVNKVWPRMTKRVCVAKYKITITSLLVKISTDKVVSFKEAQ